MMLNLKLGNWKWYCCAKLKHYKGQTIYGYTNRTKDGYYIPFLDYDNIRLEWIMPELERLQEDYGIRQIHIVRSSSNKYHVVSFDKLTFRELLRLLSDSTTDFNHFEIGRKLGLKAWTLRLNNKDKDLRPQYLLSTKEQAYARKQSTPHNNIFNKLFKANTKLKYPDHQKELILSRYEI